MKYVFWRFCNKSLPVRFSGQIFGKPVLKNEDELFITTSIKLINPPIEIDPNELKQDGDETCLGITLSVKAPSTLIFKILKHYNEFKKYHSNYLYQS